MIASDFIASEDHHNSAAKIEDNNVIPNNADNDDMGENFDYDREEEEYLQGNDDLEEEKEIESETDEYEEKFEEGDSGNIIEHMFKDRDEGDDDEEELYYDEVNGVEQNDYGQSFNEQNDVKNSEDYLDLEEDEENDGEELLPNHDETIDMKVEKETKTKTYEPKNIKEPIKSKEQDTKDRIKRGVSLSTESTEEFLNGDINDENNEDCEDDNYLGLFDSQSTKCKPGETFCMETGQCTSGSCHDGSKTNRIQIRYFSASPIYTLHLLYQLIIH